MEEHEKKRAFGLGDRSDDSSHPGPWLLKARLLGSAGAGDSDKEAQLASEVVESSFPSTGIVLDGVFVS